MVTPRIVIASRNQGKIAELARLLGDLEVVWLSLDEGGVDAELVEDGSTFLENAVRKADQARDLSGLPALADDSGLCVDALGGRPGVQSARFGGPGLSDAERVDLLLQQLQDVPWERRRAQFVAVLALAAPGKATVTVTGMAAGYIAEQPRGSGGFGYDPVFYVPDLGATFAEVATEVKDQFSHRGRAARAMRHILVEHLNTVEPGDG